MGIKWNLFHQILVFRMNLVYWYTPIAYTDNEEDIKEPVMNTDRKLKPVNMT